MFVWDEEGNESGRAFKFKGIVLPLHRLGDDSPSRRDTVIAMHRKRSHRRGSGSKREELLREMNCLVGASRMVEFS